MPALVSAMLSICVLMSTLSQNAICYLYASAFALSSQAFDPIEKRNICFANAEIHAWLSSGKEDRSERESSLVAQDKGGCAINSWV